MRGIIYTRVSSDEQVQGTSLDDQERRCREYCKERGIEIARIFREEGASAKSTSRKAFLEAIQYCKDNKGKVDAFIVYKIDRFSRKVEDYVLVKRTLLEQGTSIVSISEPTGSNPTEKYLETLLAATAELDNDLRRLRCSSGMEARVQGGIWPWRAPLGYKMAPEREKGTKKNIPDVPHEVAFPILQTALRELARGEYSKASFAARLDSLGMRAFLGKKLTPQGVQLILEERRLRFYAGQLYNPWSKEFVQGLHVPMLAAQELSDILDVLNGKKRKWSRAQAHELFPLRGTVRCNVCNHTLTGSSSRGNTKLHHYYHCYNKQCLLYAKSIRKDDLEKAFAEELNKISPTPGFIKSFKEAVLKEWEVRCGQYKRAESESQKRLDELKRKKERIYELREDGSYSAEEFRQRKEKIEIEILALSATERNDDIEKNDLEDLLEGATPFLEALGSHWIQKPVAIQQRFQKLVYPDGISYSREIGVGTGKMSLILELNKEFQTQKSSLVDRTGFEPATPSLQKRCSTN